MFVAGPNKGLFQSRGNLNTEADPDQASTGPQDKVTSKHRILYCRCTGFGVTFWQGSLKTLVLLRRQFRVDVPIRGVEKWAGLQLDVGNERTVRYKSNKNWVGRMRDAKLQGQSLSK